MDPYNEETLRNEIIFLHSLWHQGPPPPPPPHHHHFLHPQNPKKGPFSNPPEKLKKMKTQQQIQLPTSEWPCPSTNSPNSTTWPTFPTTLFPSQADIHFSDTRVQAWDVGNRMQLKFVQEVKKFFKDQKEESDDDEEEEDMEDEGDDEDEYLGFFLKLFEENVELREFYVENCENGEFGCLVCGGVGFIRRFKNCVALVQHTMSISKTKKMRAHRAFGEVVCRVLGWDIKKLPSIASFISEKKNAGSSKSEEEKVAIKDHNVESHDKVSGEKEFSSAISEKKNAGSSKSEEKILSNEVYNVESCDKETGEKESASAIDKQKNAASSKLEEEGHEEQETPTIEDHNVESRDEETGEKEFAGAEQLPEKSANGAIAVTEAFGQVVCEVLGCDINKLPSIASSITEKNANSNKVKEEHHEMAEKLTNEDHNVKSRDEETKGSEAFSDPLKETGHLKQEHVESISP